MLDFVAGLSLWQTDGTSAHTTKVASDPTYSGLGNLFVDEVAVAAGTVYFAARTSLSKLDATVPGGVTVLAASPRAIHDLHSC